MDKVDAMRKLATMKYSEDDCRSGADIREWALKLLRVARAAGFETVEQ